MKKKSKIEILRMIMKGALLAGGVAVLLMTLYYVIVVAKGYYHSDCTDTILWAEAAWEAKALMNPDFTYACLLPFGGQLLMLPFVAVFGVGMKAQIIGMVLFTLIFAASIIALFRRFQWSYPWIAVALSAIFLVCSSSEKMREIFWGHIIYYSLGLLFLLVGMNLVLKLVEQKEISWKYTGLFFIWTALCSMNGVQALTIYGLPVLAALAAERFFDFKKDFSWKENKTRYVAILTMILAFAVGSLLASLVNGKLVAGYANAYSGFSNPDQWVENLLNLFPQYLTLLGVKINTKMLIYSKDGIVNLLRIIVCLILFVVPVIMAACYKKIELLSYRLMIWVHFALATLIGLGWMVGELNSANWRLIPVVITSMILCLMFAHWIFYHTNCKRVLLVLAVPMILVLGTVFIELGTMEKQSETNRKLEQLVEYLEENDMNYGYATFWQANILTLLSDSKVKVRDILLADDGYHPRKYQSNKNWYNRNNGYKEYFVILTDYEMQQYYLNPECDYKIPERRIEYNGYHILVYGENIFE